MKRRPPLCRLTFRESGFAFDPASGRTYAFSDTGLRVAALLRDGCPESDLADRLVAEYDVDRLRAQRDVDSFLVHLRSCKLS
jgi:Coenzyme PQQ synthesis protein D (PqqD)